MALEEITQDSTSAEISEYADQVAKEVEAERAGEKKGDAQITSEHAENEHRASKPTVEKKTDDGGESAAKETAEGRDWLDDDLKGEVAAYGIEESELADFANREELERALRLFDKSALEAGRKALAETEGEGRARNEKGEFAKVEKKPEPKSEPKPGAYEITLNKEVYDEALVDEFTRLRDHYETRLSELESRFTESDARAEEKQFDNLVDSLGHADLFGKSDEEDAKQLQRRKDLHVAVKAQMLGLAQLGRPTDLSELLVSRVARMVFAEDLSKKELKNHTRKITRQSNSRQGGGATRPQDAREDPRDEADRLYKEMERT